MVTMAELEKRLAEIQHLMAELFNQDIKANAAKDVEEVKDELK
jgi:hypothetical protein